jgi:hypothetical protein
MVLVRGCDDELSPVRLLPFRRIEKEYRPRAADERSE